MPKMTIKEMVKSQPLKSPAGRLAAKSIALEMLLEQISQPLTVILGRLELTKISSSMEEVQDHIKQAHTACLKLKKLVEEYKRLL